VLVLPGRGQLRRAGGRRGRPGKRVASWLAWHEAHAATLEKLRARLAKTTDAALALTERQIADILDQEPERDYAVATCIGAWFDLSTARAIGMAAGPIPWSAIVQWCQFHQLDREASMILIHVIRQVDNERAEAAEARRKLEEMSRGRGKR
jgi:hypothetical protein